MNKSPSEVLAQMAESKRLKVSSEKFASYLDQQDELSHFREFIHHPDCKYCFSFNQTQINKDLF